MNIKRLLSSIMLAALTMVSFQASANNINIAEAKAVANNFIKQNSHAINGRFNSTAIADIKLVHAEASSKVAGANAYYAFNLDGGGFIIIAGEDRATQVLGYSDKGRIDFNNLPAPLKDLLDGYKREIEFLQTYEGNDLVTEPSFNASGTVGPLIQTTWGQEMPYYLQCPIYQGEYCVVGCVATAMAQVMNYWQYPTSSSAIERFYSYGYGYVEALPATTFDYSLMLNSYCHWDWDNSQLIQDTYTDAQAQEVAKLGRYCGQAVDMQYSPEGSGAYTDNQLSAMKTFGYSNASLASKGYGGSSSTWESKLKSDLDAGRPILYSASDPSAGGHAFICDGYNSNGYFHFNLGWYGTCDGWYTTSSLRMVHRDGDQLNFSSSHQIVYKLEPPTYCIIDAENIYANTGLIVLGEDLGPVAQNVTMRTSYSNVNLAFTLTDANNHVVATSDAINLDKNSYVQGSDINGVFTLPTTLEPGEYNVQFNYYSNNTLQAINKADGPLVVVGRVAKFNSNFDVEDITKMIDYVLNNHPGSFTLDVTDVTNMISYVLSH